MITVLFNLVLLQMVIQFTDATNSGNRALTSVLLLIETDESHRCVITPEQRRELTRGRWTTALI